MLIPKWAGSVAIGLRYAAIAAAAAVA
eukprot:SAG11_NODE_10167_length_850_cov_1.191744_2_plen_26_part_01